MGKRLKEIFIIIFIILLCIGLFIIYNGITNNGIKELITNRYFGYPVLFLVKVKQRNYIIEINFLIL